MRAWGSSVVPWMAPLRNVVTLNKRSIAWSLVMLCNIFLMPLKAYISEPFPWTSVHVDAIPSDCAHNFTNCGPQLLEFFRNQSQFLSEDAPHIATKVYDLVRVSFPLPTNASSPDAYVTSMPYALFYCASQRDLAHRFATNQIHATDFASAQIAAFLTSPIAFSVIWASNDTTTPGGGIMHMGYVRAATSTWWTSIKFVFRLLLSMYLVWCTWAQYFVHVKTLYSQLTTIGLATAPGRSLELIVGDPTSVVLLNPVVALFFIVDFWISADFVSLAFTRVAVVTSPTTYFIASLYLSRTLWFAYGSLSVMSGCLKRLGKAHLFHAVDPSWTAVAVMCVAGPFTTLQTRLPFLIDLYNWIFYVLASSSTSIETSAAAIVYTALVGGLPILFGLFPRHKPRLLVGPRVSATSPASYLENDVKARWALSFTFMSRAKKANGVNMLGGSVYQLFQAHPALRRELCMSQRGGDCYIVYDDIASTVSVRVSPLECLDHHRPPLTVAAAVPGHILGRVDMRKDAPMLILGDNNSKWIM
ncbi:hypothetical protein SDRG_16295 [Saprolegnia diclina VS20]|uniref:Uncharacterized protein n=1 Tax=Saprolegnia diclina (strain VS20) TaxID=1156394 RepID=T0PUD5_SAPDV|nr:hypothetical protein SDRG_16295 [Saprolegnia diclina VS20]EQC25846.1 hypothetical protein SDRG_16295 [Saprolegnia diclina VS20]|eukprot:XP_008620721.1 hypothetical protein SDRG_16295 [Saprolegnia diclina VS20]